MAAPFFHSRCPGKRGEARAALSLRSQRPVVICPGLPPRKLILSQMAVPFVLLLIASSFLQIWASDPLYYESFDEPFEGRWIVSKKEDYEGLWRHSKSDGHEDYGLLVSEKGRKHAIVKELDEPIILKDGTVILQFEVRLQNGLECGGAYLKYLRPQKAGWTAREFDNESPYTIMFGPDKCGGTDKVHFIFPHKNPKTGQFVEHHLKYAPTIPYDKLSHVYTAILKPDNELRILIDGEERRKANFLSSDDFEPAFIPPKTIPDPDDKKPEDWDERTKIPDPDAVKPDDWDEDAPEEIEDEEAVKPEGWLDDEPEEIDDPGSIKPKDWDDEEDGEWEAIKIDNPNCEAAPGCGEWKRPMKRNPAYKGKWHAPLIDNTNYKGIWKPREIDNPDYFELDKPDFEPIIAIGIEILTMQDGILFDNILISRDEKVAESYRAETWKPKYEVEKEKEKAEDGAAGFSDMLSGFQKKVFDVLYKIADIPFLEAYKNKIIDAIEMGEKQPNLTIGILVSIVVVIVTVISRVLFGGEKPKVCHFGFNPSLPFVDLCAFCRLLLHLSVKLRLLELVKLKFPKATKRKRRRTKKMNQPRAPGGPGGRRRPDMS
ncbi:calnexin homolog 1-like isoform X1 [Musa acuminata AAA Group]|uniref:calnexin homolog 1-like isoform X1 n=1 Tax=Musa acuminata AAA Group TaxID=214697 RepID=UPI0031D41BFA